MDFEKTGQFYLGRKHDLQSGVTSDQELVMYDSRDLTTHAVCVGMTGSGKTGLCLTLLEEAAIDGIPAICIDPKGDLGNLMLTFPDLAATDFEPWVDPLEAGRKGISPAQYAAEIAATWKQGLAEWGQSKDRIRLLRQAADVAIYTPASDAGIPLTVLQSFQPPPQQVRDDPDAMREQILSTVSGLLALLSIDADPVSSREHILLSSILEDAWRSDRAVDMGSLIRSIQSPPFDKVGFLDLESFYPSDERFRLAMALNNLVASPGFAAWLEGEPLDIQQLLYTSDGRPRLAILSIAHLSESERMFFVTIVLNAMLAWTRSQPGTSSLRAILYMDEVFGYFPPTANPPSKRPMLTLLKQARAHGVGCVLATQNPVDLDYKGLSNAGTWFLGRLQTERDKLRVLEGLEGAATASGGGFNRSEMDQILSGLGSRVFLMNNVHDGAPVVFRSRWALSWLRGPMTRQQIRQLMDPVKSGRTVPSSAAVRSPVSESSHRNPRPVVPPGIEERFVAVRTPGEQIVYRPTLFGQGRLHFVDSRRNVDHWTTVTLLYSGESGVPQYPWEDADRPDRGEAPELQTEPCASDAAFCDVPSEMLSRSSYTVWKKSLKEYFYQSERLVLHECTELKIVSRPDESENDFRIRLRHAAREERDRQIDALRDRYATRFASLEDQLRSARQRLERERSQRTEKGLSAAVSLGTSILSAFFGRSRRSGVSQAGTAVRSASRVAKEQEDIRHAEEQLLAIQRKRDELNELIEQEIHEIQDRLDPDVMELQSRELKPRKSDITADLVVLAWLPQNL